VKFEVTVLGSSAALPTGQRNSTAQHVFCQNKHILIDCGEGTQLQMRKYNISFQRLNIILISHLHGDHFFGLVGLISTMMLLGRNSNLTVICPKGLKDIVLMQLEIGYTKLNFDIDFIELEPKTIGCVYEDKSIQITTFPLKHRVPTHGYVIREKEKERSMKKELLNHPQLKIEHIHRLKKGEDIHLEDGSVLLSKEFTDDPAKPKAYAFCSDTAYSEQIVDFVKDVDMLYHEATFTEIHEDLARKTYHSTAKQAATIAKKANVGRLLMGHLSARYTDGKLHEEEAMAIFPNACYVNDGMCLSIE